MESITGLPAHPLLVHAPAVLVPLLTVVLVAMAARPPWRRRLGPAVLVAALALTVATFLTVRSGEAFEEIIGDRVDVSEHEELGQTTMRLVAGTFVVVLLTVGADRWAGRAGPSWLRPAGLGLSVLAALVAVAATYWMIRTGHEGARLVWDGVIPEDG